MTHLDNTPTPPKPAAQGNFVRQIFDFLARTITEADTIDRGIDSYKSRF